MLQALNYMPGTLDTFKGRSKTLVNYILWFLCAFLFILENNERQAQKLEVNSKSQSEAGHEICYRPILQTAFARQQELQKIDRTIYFQWIFRFFLGFTSRRL